MEVPGPHTSKSKWNSEGGVAIWVLGLNRRLMLTVVLLTYTRNVARPGAGKAMFRVMVKSLYHVRRQERFIGAGDATIFRKGVDQFPGQVFDT